MNTQNAPISDLFGSTGEDLMSGADSALETTSDRDLEALSLISKLDQELEDHFGQELVIDRSLTRQLVSFQANKNRAAYRWFKYKEAFSGALIEYLLARYRSGGTSENTHDDLQRQRAHRRQ